MRSCGGAMAELRDPAIKLFGRTIAAVPSPPMPTPTAAAAAAAASDQVEPQEESPEVEKVEKGGYKTYAIEVKGNRVYSKVKYESGVHCVQRVPQTEAQGRVPTSTATVAIMPEEWNFYNYILVKSSTYVYAPVTFEYSYILLESRTVSDLNQKDLEIFPFSCKPNSSCTMLAAPEKEGILQPEGKNINGASEYSQKKKRKSGSETDGTKIETSKTSAENVGGVDALDKSLDKLKVKSKEKKSEVSGEEELTKSKDFGDETDFTEFKSVEESYSEIKEMQREKISFYLIEVTSQDGAEIGYGAKAQKILGQVRGRIPSLWALAIRQQRQILPVILDHFFCIWTYFVL